MSQDQAFAASSSAEEEGEALKREPPDVDSVKQEEEREEKHCICDYRDYSTFMIACDECKVWYHGSCVQITRTASKRIKNYYCPQCISKNANLAILYSTSKTKESNEPVVKKEELPKGHKELVEKIADRKAVTPSPAPNSTLSGGGQQQTKVAKGCGNCIGCFRTSDCGKCQSCLTGKKPCQSRVCVQLTAKNVKMEPPSSTSKPAGKQLKGLLAKKKAGSGGAVAKKVKTGGTSLLAKAYNTYHAKKKAKAEKEEERQCYGPKCTYSARPGSRYCSDECGMALAQLRLKLILPERISEFYRQRPAADVHDWKKIEELEESKLALHQELSELNGCLENLESWITAAAAMKATSNDESQTATDDGAFLVHCAVCSTEVSYKSIGKHMQRCFVRLERQSTFGAPGKLPTNPHNIHCEAYNKIDKTYCRRLRVMCSEHYKGSGDEGDKLCGCPEGWDQPSEFKALFKDFSLVDSKGFCMERRKQCLKHHNWEQTALGLIDNERLNILQREDEIIEKIRQLKQKSAHRGDVISLLCNKTITHDPQLHGVGYARQASMSANNDVNEGVKCETATDSYVQCVNPTTFD